MTTTGRIDVHTHLLPNVDDGCTSAEDSVRCARMLVEAGYAHAFCTPHIWPSLPHNSPESIVRGVAALQATLDEASVPLKLHSGGEIGLLAMWPRIKEWPRVQIVSYSMAGKFVLFDFWIESLDEVIRPLEAAVRFLQSQHFTPILAHPERIGGLQRESNDHHINWLRDMGVLLQMNTWCLDEPRDSPIQHTAERLLSENQYFCFGTDCHNARTLPKRLNALQTAIDLVGEARVYEMTVINPKKFLG